MAPHEKITSISLLRPQETDTFSYSASQVNEEENKKKIQIFNHVGYVGVPQNNVWGMAEAGQATNSSHI